MKLIDFVLNREEVDLPSLFSTTESISAGQIKQKKADLEQTLSFIRGKNIALCFKSNMELAIHLILLDGIANRLLILPADCLQAQRECYLLLSECTEVVSDFLEKSSLADINNTMLKNLQANDINTEWVLTTSGTTGVPKLVKHTLNSLIQTVKHNNKGKPYVWGCLYHLHRFAGIQVFLQSMIANSQLVIMESSDSLSELINLFNEHHVNCLSATPTLWRNILMLPNSNTLSLSQITLGGEIADENILLAISKAYPTAKVRHIYASTETGVGFSVSDGFAGFPVTYLNNDSLAVQLKISNKNTLLIKSSATSSGYIGSKKITDKFEFIDTGDVISIKGDRCYFIGRENGTINVGGNKVNPEYIEQILMKFPGVNMAYVSAKKSSIMGSLVQCQVVLDEGLQDKQSFIKRLKLHCKSELLPYMVPALFKVVDKLKLNSTGKISRDE